MTKVSGSILTGRPMDARNTFEAPHAVDRAHLPMRTSMAASCRCTLPPKSIVGADVAMNLGRRCAAGDFTVPKCEHGLLGVGLRRAAESCWESRLIRRVGKVLGLEAQAGAVTKHAALTRGLAIHEIARIELQTRLRGANFQRAAAGGVGEHGGQAQRRCLRAVEHPVVIVAVAERELLVVGLDAAADDMRRAEIERRAGNRRAIRRSGSVSHPRG